MNMILFGDGHANVEMMDSLNKPVHEKYDMILTNIPFSQKTAHGNYYPIPSNDGNSVCVQHCYEALKKGGRAAIIVPYTFTYDDGVMRETREMIFRNTAKLTVVDLPHGVFLPYTPTRASIICFEKGDGLHHAFFFRVRNDGFELKTKRIPVPGPSDITKLLDYISPERELSDQAVIVARETIEKTANLSFRAPDYIIQHIKSPYNVDLRLLGEIIEERDEQIIPASQSDRLWPILGVTRRGGVFLEKLIPGSKIHQRYKIVRAGDLVYNPYRINIGSIGRVPPYYDRMLISSAYVVFTSGLDVPNEYILWVLRTEKCRDIICFYGHGSVRNTLWFDDLCRIAIPLPPKKERGEIMPRMERIDQNLQAAYKQLEIVKRQAQKYLGEKIEEPTPITFDDIEKNNKGGL